jgi:hypothetical protein
VVRAASRGGQLCQNGACLACPAPAWASGAVAEGVRAHQLRASTPGAAGIQLSGAELRGTSHALYMSANCSEQLLAA